MKFRLPAWSILLIICILVGAMLGVVNSLTAGPIAQQAIEQANAARQISFSSADSFEEIALDADSGIDSCYAAMKDGQLAGYVAQVTVTGFGGPIEIHVGLDLEQTITGIHVGGSKFSETPGLGAKATDTDFTDQFTGLTIPTQLGSGVDAITGATITSGAVSSGVNKGGYFIRDLINPPAEDNRPEDLQFGGVLPGATTKEQQTAPEGIDELYTSDAGVVLYVTGKGRNGDMQVQVGVGHSGQVAGVFIDPAMHKETEGLGDLVEEPYFWGQFIGNTGVFTAGENIDAVSGATITSETVIDCVNRAVAAAQPYLDPSKATDIALMGESTAPAQSGGSGVQKRTQVVKTGSGVTVMTALDWAQTYPEIYASYLANSENDEVLDHVEEYPMIGVVYEGMAFNKYYGTARGHTYTVQDVTATGRPHALANCFSCKTPDFTAMVNEMGETAYTLAFADVLAQVNESISCYNCHANTGNELVITHTYLADALGEELEDVEAATLSCGQCHVEYYFHPTTKATSLPYTSLDTMSPDAILAYYNSTQVNGQVFADYVNPRTGVRQIKVQHPEFETYMGEGSVHADTFTCADCHMGEATAADGTTYISHTWTSPLDNQALLEGTCAECHADLAQEVAQIQEEAERRTYAIGYELEALTEKLAKAVESGSYTEAELNAIRSLARDAQFYWDFVFVENSEGAHNSQLTEQCLDKAETLLNQAMGLFRPQEG
nr:ammonia-forming cytochrome c nitrite reductase subunit c552 [Oscillospiraceae bacterium]